MYSHLMRLKTLLCVMMALFAQPVLAQNYPNKPIRFVVGFTPGGPNDMVARIVGQKLTETFGVPVTVDNRPGADSMIGTQLVVRSPADGYTIAILTSSSTIHPSVYSDVPFDLVKDLSSVGLVASTPFLVVVNPALPVKSIKDLIALAKAKPGQLNFASSGQGGTLHMAGELFKSLAHVNMNHVAYKGGAPAVNDVIGGHVELMFGPIGVGMPHVKSGRLRALAVTSAKRWPALPDLPTVAEAGVPGYEAGGWYGIVAPARTPRAIIMRLNEEVAKMLPLPDVRQRLANFDLEAIGGSPEQMQSRIEADIAKWKKVAQDAKIAPGSLH